METPPAVKPSIIRAQFLHSNRSQSHDTTLRTCTPEAAILAPFRTPKEICYSTKSESRRDEVRRCESGEGNPSQQHPIANSRPSWQLL
jgi:hypothetical protein